MAETARSVTFVSGTEVEIEVPFVLEVEAECEN
jgi:hypothetical protein